MKFYIAVEEVRSVIIEVEMKNSDKEMQSINRY